MKVKNIEKDGDFLIQFENDKEKEDFSIILTKIVNYCKELIFDDSFLDTVLAFVGIGKSVNLENEISSVTFNDPATIVFWKDGTKTVTKCRKGDTFNKETGLAMCIIRKLCNNRNYNSVFKKYCD